MNVVFVAYVDLPHRTCRAGSFDLPRRLAAPVLEWSRENSRYHSDIVAALRRGDADTAAALMQEHMEQAHGHLEQIYGDVSLEDIALGAGENS